MMSMNGSGLPASSSRRRGRGLSPWLRAVLCCTAVLTLALLAAPVLAQVGGGGAGGAGGADPNATAPATPAGGAGGSIVGEGGEISLFSLFRQSFDLFTVLLIIGSLAGWTIIFICLLEIRKNNIAPEEPEQIIADLINKQRWGDLRAFVAEDDALVSKAVRAAINTPSDDKEAVRDAAEMAASEECAKWFRKIEPLNVLGNIGPLLGLAGTVWGMILAFAALQSSQGQASPAILSGGIAKALFHTLLGLLLAVPCLTVFGLYRTFIDKLCTRAMVVAGEFVELLPRDPRVRMSLPSAGFAAGGARPGPAPAAMPQQTTPRG